MLSRRVKVNLALFVVLGLLATAYAVTNVLSIDAITHPFYIRAEFTTSPGLKKNFEVAYLGVQVGSISAVDLQPGKAVVTLRLNHGTRIPRGVTAAAARQSVVGEPYVELAPPARYTGGGPFIGKGYVIPLAETTTPLSYQQVFDAIGRLISAVPPSDLNGLLHSLALGLNGRSDEIRQLLENSAALSQTFAANAPEIDQTIAAASQLSQTLADHGTSLSTSFDNLAAISSALAGSREDIATLLTQTPGILQQFNSVLGASAGSLGCIIDGLGTIASILGTPSHVNDLAQVLGLSPELLEDLQHMNGQGPDGAYIKGTITANVFGPAPPQPAAVQTLPTPPAIPSCGSSGAGAPAAGSAGSSGGARAGGPGASPVANVGRHGGPPGSALSPTTPISHRSFPFTLLALALIILGVALSRPWRWVPAWIRRGR